MSGWFELGGLLVAVLALGAVLSALLGGPEWRQERARIMTVAWLAYRLVRPRPVTRGRRRA